MCNICFRCKGGSRGAFTPGGKLYTYRTAFQSVYFHSNLIFKSPSSDTASGRENFAKSKNIDGEVYTSKVQSFTYGREYDITLAKKFLNSGDRVLILDDFLANGKAMKGLLDVCNQAGCSVAGIGICIEKGFQPGGAELRAAGYKLASLAIVNEMSDDHLTFREQ